MILSDKDTLRLIEEGRLGISPFAKEDVLKTGHINLHLAPKLLRYKESVLDLKKGTPPLTEELILPDSGYELRSGEFLLGSTVERISIPNDHFGFIETKGNIARAGIQVHNTDGHIDPGFSGMITLEIKNNANHSIVLYPNIPFAQLYIFELSSESLKTYSGKYQNQDGPTIYRKD